jgi:hypothetical protein
MKIDWRFVLVLVAALVTIIALKTQTENLDGEVEEETEKETEKETEETEEETEEETKEPEPAYPDVSGFVAELNGVNGNIKFTDLAMIENLLGEVKVTSDPKSYVYCSENCGPDVMSNPEMKDQQKKCNVGCDQFLSGACKVGCALNADAPECEGFCSSYLE